MGNAPGLAPLSPLHIKDSSDDMLKLESTDSTVYLEMSDNTTTNPGQIGQTNQDMWIKTGGNNKRITVLGTGNVGIGETNPDSILHVKFSDTYTSITSQLGEGIIIENSNTTNNNFNSIQFSGGNSVMAQVGAQFVDHSNK